METVEPIQKNIYQSNTYSKDLRWLHLDVGTCVCACISVYNCIHFTEQCETWIKFKKYKESRFSAKIKKGIETFVSYE